MTLHRAAKWASVPAGLLLVLLTGCALPDQPKQEVLIREPGNRQYSPPAPASEVADTIWPYAVLSANVYRGISREGPAVMAAPSPSEVEAATADTINPHIKACVERPADRLPLDGWTAWPDFPSPGLRRRAEELGLYLEVWENKSLTPPVVAIVFRGSSITSLRDWQSNLHWFTRFIPFYEDQYTTVSSTLGDEFVKESVALGLGLPTGAYKDVRVVSTGHSLGGGLAQHFAYSLPLDSPKGIATPRVSHVYAFDPSPVTGWSSVDRERRAVNARDLTIERIFEHGEILAYLRLVQSYFVPPSEQAPAIREIRFNFWPANPLASHSMTRLACDLAQARTFPARIASEPAPRP